MSDPQYILYYAWLTGYNPLAGNIREVSPKRTRFWDTANHSISEIIVRDDHACVGYGGGEVWVRPYQILAYADPHRR